MECAGTAEQVPVGERVTADQVSEPASLQQDTRQRDDLPGAAGAEAELSAKVMAKVAPVALLLC